MERLVNKKDSCYSFLDKAKFLGNKQIPDWPQTRGKTQPPSRKGREGSELIPCGQIRVVIRMKLPAPDMSESGRRFSFPRTRVSLVWFGICWTWGRCARTSEFDVQVQRSVGCPHLVPQPRVLTSEHSTPHPHPSANHGFSPPCCLHPPLRSDHSPSCL